MKKPDGAGHVLLGRHPPSGRLDPLDPVDAERPSLTRTVVVGDDVPAARLDEHVARHDRALA